MPLKKSLYLMVPLLQTLNIIINSNKETMPKPRPAASEVLKHNLLILIGLLSPNLPSPDCERGLLPD